MKGFLRKILIIAGAGIGMVLTAGFIFSFVGKPPVADDIIWGVNFSRLHSQLLGLDWRANYTGLVDDLGARYLRIPVYWQDVEPKEGEFNFEDYDWMIAEAEKRGAKIILTVGRKIPRWPECHVPEWAKELSEELQQQKVLSLVEQAVSRYKASGAISRWQVENEAFFPFGVCPAPDTDFYRKEIALVRSLDSRPIVVADSGEGSMWFGSARLGDVVGTTMYKKIWVHQIGKYFTWPFNPIFYWRKAEIIRKLFGDEVIVAEFQAEPWGPKLLYDVSLEEMEKTMNLNQFKFMVDFGRRTGLSEFYFWGSEWWWWMKEKQNRPEIWEEAKRVIRASNF